jgi:hypothetical protein
MEGEMGEIKTVGDIVDRLPAPRQAVTPMQMLQIAIERGADVSMLEKLMGLQERWEANEARKAFVAAKAAFVAERPTIIKNKTVSFGSGKSTAFDHATLDNVCNVVGPVLSRHGLSASWRTAQGDGGKIRVSCVLTHEQGHSEEVWLEGAPDTSGSKNAIQAIGSAVTYLSRYTLLSILGLATRDQDDDARMAGMDGLISPAQKEEIVSLLRDTDADVKRFLVYMQVDAVDEIPASRFPEAKAALEKKKKDKTSG